MKQLYEKVKKNWGYWLPIAILNMLIVLGLYLFEKYWSLQPLSRVYIVVISLQFITWLVVLRINNEVISQNKSLSPKTAFIIGLIWSVIQIFWLSQWWTWLNLFSQPVVYMIVSIILIKIHRYGIDLADKIRHYDVDQNL